MYTDADDMAAGRTETPLETLSNQDGDGDGDAPFKVGGFLVLRTCAITK